MMELRVTFTEATHKGLLRLLTRKKGFQCYPNPDNTFYLIKKVRNEINWYKEEAKYLRLLLKYSINREKGDRQKLNLKLDREKFEREVIEPIRKARLEFSDEVGELPEYQTPAERRREALENPPGIINHTPFTLPDESP